ncbi:hypothetical protein [Microbacterium sp. NIBRBAC000506063]|uniref:SbtR family transcriptional regulator n=1 Tax=Microbacterium sp. NIBRBAC000506063 TaxID=2734618 RepID=UPI001BB7FE6D|nr:hypothetical protein [Microbacterium sp. NIBRBAC000506063]QTV79442.1 hypothetical protein KAE78_11095 [Microbacterium sp. NIBRBAC000506063]
MRTEALGDPLACPARHRLRAVVAEVLRSAQASGEVRADVEAEDLLVAVPMLALTVAKAPEGLRRDTGARARRVIEARFLA